MLRWAILGTGFISNTVVEAIGHSDGSTVVSVAGRNPDSVQEFRTAHGIGRGHVDFAEAIEAPDVDVVYGGLPNHKHHAVAAMAAAAGKALLSEKSLTTTMDTAHELVDAVRGRVFCVEGLMYLAHPLYNTVVELLESGRLGVVKSINGSYSADIAAVVNPAGRGTIFNLGCYPASLLHLVMQTCHGPDAFMDRQTWGAGTLTRDGTVGQAVLGAEFGCGVLATLHSTDDFGMAHHFSIATDRGELRFETNPWLPIAGPNVLTWTAYGAEPSRIDVHDHHDGFYHQIKLVEAGVAAGDTEARRPSPTLDDSLEVMGLLTDWEKHCLDR
jgi:dihydrodiol dehydrogenase / D-xylose 1-dehydrogenase (NADP)